MVKHYSHVEDLLHHSQRYIRVYGNTVLWDIVFRYFL